MDDLAAPKADTAAALTIDDLTAIFDKAMKACRRCYLPDLLIKQLFIQVSFRSVPGRWDGWWGGRTIASAT